MQGILESEEVSLEGFTHASTSTTPDGTIVGDGSTVVRIYFTRDYRQIDISISNGRAGSANTSGGRYLFDQELTVVFTINQGYSIDRLSGFTFTYLVDGEPTAFEDLEFDVQESDNEQGTKDYTITFKVPAQDVTLNILPTRNPDTAYKVVYMFQTTALGANYEQLVQYPEETQYGETEHILTREDIGCEDMSVTGFELFSTTIDAGNVEIAGDGSTIVYVYFNRIQMEVTLDFDDEMDGYVPESIEITTNGTPAVMKENNIYYVSYGQTLAIAIDIYEGFTFGGYTIDDSIIEGQEGTEVSFVVERVENFTIKITILASANTQYKIEYYREDLDDDSSATNFEEDPVLEQVRTGTTHYYFSPEEIQRTFIDGIANIPGYEENDFVGFEFAYYTVTDSEGDATGFAQIVGDGSMVMRFYYMRKLINVSISYDDEQIESVTGEGAYTFGAEVTITATPKPGYEFVSWKIGEELIYEQEYTFIITEDVDIEIELASTVGPTTYTVEHYFEVLGSGYVLREEYTQTEDATTENTIGTGEEVDINISQFYKTETGYEWAYNGEENYTIAGDGSTVVQIYYRLKTVTFTVRSSQGINSITIEKYTDDGNLEFVSEDVQGVLTYRATYTTRLSLNVELSTGYEFLGWILNNSMTAIPGSAGVTRGFLYDVPAEDFTLDARAIVRQVTIIFDPNNGQSGESVPQYANFNTDFHIIDNPFTNGNMTFLGWATEPDGDVVYLPGDVLHIDFEDTLTLYAVWEEQKSNLWWLWILLIIILLIIIIIIIRW